MESDNLSKIMSQGLSTLLILGTVFVSLIMLAGYSYNVGYLGSFGLGPDDLALTFYDSVSAAFSMGMTLLVGIIKRIWWIYSAIIAIAIFFLFIIILAIIIKRFKWENKVLAITDPNKKVMGMDYNLRRGIVEMILMLFSIVFAFVLLIGLPIFVLASPYIKGVEEGKKQLETYQEIDYDCKEFTEVGYRCTSLRNLDNGKIEAQGLFVSATDNVIVIRDGELNRIFSRSPEFVLEILPAKLKKTESNDMDEKQDFSDNVDGKESQK